MVYFKNYDNGMEILSKEAHTYQIDTNDDMDIIRILLTDKNACKIGDIIVDSNNFYITTSPNDKIIAKHDMGMAKILLDSSKGVISSDKLQRFLMMGE